MNANDSGYYAYSASNKLKENVQACTYVSIKKDSLKSNLEDFLKSEEFALYVRIKEGYNFDIISKKKG